MRPVKIAIVILLIAISCRDKVICPAFQSTYILDDSTRIAYYSYAWKLDDQTRQQYFASLPASADTNSTNEDPMMRYFAYAEQIVPPVQQVNKTKFGIVKYEPYWLKNYRLRTAPKENKLGPGPVQTEEEIDAGEFVASDFASDSLETDSVAMVSPSDSTGMLPEDSLSGEFLAKKSEEDEPKYLYRYDPEDDFNVEQEYYNKYFGEKFIDNRPERIDPSDTTAAREGGFLDFFRNLFGNKKNISSDSTSVVQQPEPSESSPPTQPLDSIQNNPSPQENPEEEEGGN